MTHVRETRSHKKLASVSYWLAARYFSREFLASNRACSISCEFLVRVSHASVTGFSHLSTNLLIVCVKRCRGMGSIEAAVSTVSPVATLSVDSRQELCKLLLYIKITSNTLAQTFASCNQMYCMTLTESSYCQMIGWLLLFVAAAAMEQYSPATCMPVVTEQSVLTAGLSVVKREPAESTQDASGSSSSSADWYHCHTCDIYFRSVVMYTIHAGAHSRRNPLECNVCGRVSRDCYEFAAHLSYGDHCRVASLPS